MADRLLSYDSADALLAVFGSYDENVRLLEKEFQVQILTRDTEVKVTGEPDHVNMACKTFDALFEMAKCGENITDQAVRYLISLAKENEI